MAYVKVREGVLAGTEALDGIAVVSDDFYAARSFGPSGYDEGDLEGYRMVSAAVVVANPADEDDVRAAAAAIGRATDDEDTPNGLLLDGAVRAEVIRRGFDGFRGVEVIGNMQPEVAIVWDHARLTLHPEPGEARDVDVREDGAGGLTVTVLTTRGREAVSRAMVDHDGPIDQQGAAVLASVIPERGWRAEGTVLVSPGGDRYEATDLDGGILIHQGEASVPAASPGPRP